MKHDSVFEDEPVRTAGDDMTIKGFDAAALSTGLESLLADIDALGRSRSDLRGSASASELVRSASVDRRMLRRRDDPVDFASDSDSDYDSMVITPTQRRRRVVSEYVAPGAMTYRYLVRTSIPPSSQSSFYEAPVTPPRIRRFPSDHESFIFEPLQQPRPKVQIGLSVRDVRTARSDPRGAALDNHVPDLLDYRPSQHTETAVHRSSYAPRVRSWLSPHPIIESPPPACRREAWQPGQEHEWDSQVAMSPAPIRRYDPKTTTLRQPPRARQQEDETLKRLEVGDSPSRNTTLNSKRRARAGDVKQDQNAVRSDVPSRLPSPLAERRNASKSADTALSRWSVSTVDQRPTHSLRPLSMMLTRGPTTERLGSRVRSFGSRAQTTMAKVF